MNLNSNRNIGKIILAIWAFGAAVFLTIFGLVVWVIVHFLLKVW